MLDNLSNSSPEALRRVAQIAGRAPVFVQGDVRDATVLRQLFGRHRIDAVIATNPTFTRAGVEGLPHAEEAGGLSGAPLRDRATAVVRQLAELLAGELPIIASGGIMRGTDAANRIVAGASLVQLYTGFIYRGPELIQEAIRVLR